jgi:hypothetical protein
MKAGRRGAVKLAVNVKSIIPTEEGDILIEVTKL